MRHEKISLADYVVLPASLTKTAVEPFAGPVDAVEDFPSPDAEAEEAKAPPVAMQHFYYCGRSPSRTHGMRGKAGRH